MKGKVSLNIGIDASLLSEALEAAAVAGAEALAAMNAQTLAVLRAKMQEVYAEAAGSGGGSVRNVMAHLLFIAGNGGRLPSEDEAAFEEFVNALDNADPLAGL